MVGSFWGARSWSTWLFKTGGGLGNWRRFWVARSWSAWLFKKREYWEWDVDSKVHEAEAALGFLSRMEDWELDVYYLHGAEGLGCLSRRGVFRTQINPCWLFRKNIRDLWRLTSFWAVADTMKWFIRHQIQFTLGKFLRLCSTLPNIQSKS